MATNYNLLIKMIAKDEGFSPAFRRANNTLKQHQDAVAKTGNSYAALTKQQRLLKDYARETAVKFGINSKEFQTAAANAAVLDTQMKKLNRTLNAYGVGAASVGNNLGSVIGVATRRILPLMVIGGVTRVFTDAISGMVEFETKLSQVAAVTGSTTEQMVKFKDAAIRISAVTPKTAQEVAQLQVEMAKLGFTADEILVSMRSVVDLSIAGFFDLGQTAELVASTLNSFSLSAGYAREVTDAFAYGVSTSALSLEKLATGLPNVGAAAAEMGFSVQKTTGLLGILSDAGIDASKMGTDLRMIITKLASSGMTLDEALEKINKSTNKVTTAQEMFDVRAYLSAIALANQADKVKNLDSEYKNLSGTAERMAAIMQDNVSGSLIKVSSAWKAFIENLRGSNGYVQRFFENLASLINKVNVAMGNLDQNKIDAFASSLRAISEELVYKPLIDAGKTEKEAVTAVIDDLYKQLKNVETDYDIRFGAESGLIDLEQLDKDGKAAERSFREQIEALKMVIAENEAKLKLPIKFVASDPNGDGSGDGDTDKMKAHIFEASGYIATLKKAISELNAEIENTNDLELALKLRVERDEIKRMLSWVQGAIDGETIKSPTSLTITPRSTNLESMTEMSNDIGNVKDIISDFASSGVDQLLSDTMQGLFDAMEGGDWSNFGKNILAGMGGFIANFGKMLVTQGVLVMAAMNLASNPFTAPAAIAIGLAAVAVGTAIKAFASKGGLSGGGSSGGYSPPSFSAGLGTSRYAASGHEASGHSGNEVVFTIKGNDLVGVLNKQTVKKNNMY